LKYLITGGAGFIGSHLSDSLIERGDSVIVLDNLSTGNKGNIKHLLNNKFFEFIEGSILNRNLLHEVIQSVDHVLHFAAAVGVFTIVDKPLESLVTNIRGTEYILESASVHNKPVLIASSSEIYGKNSNGPLNEEADRIVGSPLKSRWAYSEAKAIDETMAFFYFQEKGMDIRLIRLFNTVGPRQVGHYGMVIPRFVSAALEGEPLTVYGNGSQSRCFCHIADAVEAILAVIDSSDTLGEVLNIGNNEEVSIERLAKEVIKVTKSNSQINFLPYEQAYADGFEDMQRRIPDTNKINAMIGWASKRNLTEIITDIADHMRY
jgi:UDP-glucose 4-epimerase